MESKEKRHSGRTTTKDGRKWWLVMAESKKQKDGNWKHQCGEVVISKQVAFSNRDGLFPLSGDGSVRHMTVPFCPKCELEPQWGTFGAEESIGSY